MDLLIGALTIVAVLIALYLVYNKIFNTKKSKTESSQEIAEKRFLKWKINTLNLKWKMMPKKINKLLKAMDHLL